jgi:hypothetical protein
MRKTTHMGRTLGAVEVENRVSRTGGPRHVSKIIVGTVKRYSADEQAMGMPLWRFAPEREITGKATIQSLAYALRRAGEIYRIDGTEAGLAARDRAIGTVIETAAA